MKSNRPKKNNSVSQLKNHSHQRRLNRNSLHQSPAALQGKNDVRLVSERQQKDFSETYQSKTSLKSWYGDRKGTDKDRRSGFSCYWCGYSYMCIFLSLCTAVLLTAGIAALLVGLLVKTSGSSTNRSIVLLTDKNEVIYGLWNTTVGSDSRLSSPGNDSGTYNPNEIPHNAFDQNRTTKHSSYGICNRSSYSLPQCGTNTGVYLTLNRGVSLLTSVQFCAALGLPSRDPMTITIEGSNQSPSALLSGSSWTLIYSGSSGLDIDPGRTNFGVNQPISSNTLWFNSYRLLITSIRNMSNAVQYSEVQLFGY